MMMDKKSCDKELLEKIIRELDNFKVKHFEKMKIVFKKINLELQEKRAKQNLSFKEKRAWKHTVEKTSISQKALKTGIEWGIDSSKKIISSFFEEFNGNENGKKD